MDCPRCVDYEQELYSLKYKLEIIENENKKNEMTAINHDARLLKDIIELPYEPVYMREDYYTYRNAHEKSNKNYLHDMFNHLGYALCIIIGEDPQYHHWCANQRTKHDHIARDAYYLLRYLKEKKLPKNEYVNRLYDCRNAISHWTHERGHFRSFSNKNISRNKNPQNKPSLLVENKDKKDNEDDKDDKDDEEKKDDEKKTVTASVEEYLKDADNLLQLLKDDKNIYGLCTNHKNALQNAQKNIKLLLIQFQTHKHRNGELRKSLDYAYHLTQVMKEYREFAMEEKDYNTVNVINELDHMVTCILRGEAQNNHHLQNLRINENTDSSQQDLCSDVNASCSDENCCLNKTFQDDDESSTSDSDESSIDQVQKQTTDPFLTNLMEQKINSIF